MITYIFLSLALLGWMICLIHATYHQTKDLFIHLFMPTYAFKYARDHGLWYAVLLQIIGITGLVIKWIFFEH